MDLWSWAWSSWFRCIPLYGCRTSVWAHKKCCGIRGKLVADPDYVCPRCRHQACPIDGRPVMHQSRNGRYTTWGWKPASAILVTCHVLVELGTHHHHHLLYCLGKIQETLDLQACILQHLHSLYAITWWWNLGALCSRLTASSLKWHNTALVPKDSQSQTHWPTDIIYAKLGIQEVTASQASDVRDGMGMFHVWPRASTRPYKYEGGQTRHGLNAPGLTWGHAALVALNHRTEKPGGLKPTLMSGAPTAVK